MKNDEKIEGFLDEKIDDFSGEINNINDLIISKITSDATLIEKLENANLAHTLIEDNKNNKTSLIFCRVCKTAKEAELFNKDKKKKNGLKSFCRDCDKKLNQEYYIKHWTKINKRNRTWIKDHKERNKLYNRAYYWLKLKEKRKLKKIQDQQNNTKETPQNSVNNININSHEKL